jgi:hypothetical protein
MPPCISLTPPWRSRPRRAVTDPAWQEEYRRWRPPVERLIDTRTVGDGLAFLTYQPVRDA